MNSGKIIPVISTLFALLLVVVNGNVWTDPHELHRSEDCN